MSTKRTSLGFSLVELIVSMTILVVLLLAVCGAIIQAVHLETLHAGRAAMGRTASQLAARLQEDARSSTAVFIPSVDVLGYSNSSSNGSHEVDFFRRQSAGGDAFVAYRFDSGASTVTRYEYTAALGAKRVIATDLTGSDISAFSAERKPVSASEFVAGQSDPKRVSIYYGTRELVGGNDIVIVTVGTHDVGGAPPESLSVHLAARAAPTALAILAPVGPPNTPPPTTVIPFVILRPGFALHLPHGPIHWGDPGESSSSLHWVAAAGSVEFFGSGNDENLPWFEMTSLYASMGSGTFTFRLPDGSFTTATVNCNGEPCPLFHPMPVSAPGFAPAGGVAFQSTL